jgi:hypothetical protein
MAVSSQKMRSVVARQGTVHSNSMTAIPSIPLHTAAYGVTIVLALLAIYAVMGHVVGWGSGRLNDMRYGATRTFQMDAVVGHGDGGGTPTHFIAMNLNRQVVVVEIPGGDPSKIRTLTGPYLFGADEDKTPVLLRLDDLNRDGSKDLIVNVKNEEIVYLNKEGEFKPITPEERMELAPSN